MSLLVAQYVEAQKPWYLLVLIFDQVLKLSMAS